MIYDEIGKILKEKDNFAILTHISPDGDAVGCSLGLYNALKGNGKNVCVIIDDKFPERFEFLPGSKSVLEYKNDIKNYDVVLALDCGDLDRTGNSKKLFECAKISINIDHHVTNTKFASLNIVEPNASSTGEIIYKLLKAEGYTISKNIAECIYTSILTDTGSFKYSNTTSKTMSVVGELIDYGIDFTAISDLVFASRTLEQVKLMSKVSSTIELYFDGKVSLLTLSNEMLKECGAKEEDSGEMVSIARDIKGVEVGIFIKEKSKDVYKISMRSKKYFDVKDIALAFGGGGHVRAAGCTIEGTLNEVKNKVLNKIHECLVGENA